MSDVRLPSLMSKGTSLDSTMNYSIAVNIHYVNIKALTPATVSELSRCDANGFAGLLRKKGKKSHRCPVAWKI